MCSWGDYSWVLGGYFCWKVYSDFWIGKSASWWHALVYMPCPCTLLNTHGWTDLMQHWYQIPKIRDSSCSCVSPCHGVSTWYVTFGSQGLRKGPDIRATDDPRRKRQMSQVICANTFNAYSQWEVKCVSYMHICICWKNMANHENVIYTWCECLGLYINCIWGDVPMRITQRANDESAHWLDFAE